MVFLDKDRMMDNAQKHNTCSMILSFMNSTNYDDAHYAVFSSLLLLPSLMSEYAPHNPPLTHASLSMRDKVSHPYKATILLAYFNLFMFRQKTGS
jgi:hypothetical protein